MCVIVVEPFIMHFAILIFTLADDCKGSDVWQLWLNVHPSEETAFPIISIER